VLLCVALQLQNTVDGRHKDSKWQLPKVVANFVQLSVIENLQKVPHINNSLSLLKTGTISRNSK
jgi:hypothetical protein